MYLRTYIIILAICYICTVVTSLKFCSWSDKPQQTHLINKNDHKYQKQQISTNSKKQALPQPFRSYHPQYLHSYSYPQTVTPHLYFGQLNRMNQYVFLVKNNETLTKSQATNQIFYVNGNQQFGVKNLINVKNNLRYEERNLSFAMVLQIQNMRVENVETRIYVYRYQKFLGIICKLNENYFRSFIVFISNQGKQPAPLTSTQEYTLQFKNLSAFDNKNSWKNAYQPYRMATASFVQIPPSSEMQNIFDTLMMIINYKSIQGVKKYKIAVFQFPKIDSDVEEEVKSLDGYQSIEEIRKKMDGVKLQNFSYRFTVQDNVSTPSCQNKAQQQLIQGLSYQYGTLVLKNGSRPIANEPKELFSFSPARQRFPWGFLWDDGFHCEVAIRNWPQIALNVIKSWLDTMHQSGWIPREQNRGPERQFLCSCPPFMSKDVRDGNPPTLLLALSYLARQKVLTNQNFQGRYWQKLNLWYKWFSQTQTRQVGSYIYRWYDSIQNQGSFNSGMDDFPRLRDTSGHVDCQAWMYFFATTMSEIKQSLFQSGINFKQEAQKIKQKLLQNFIEPISNTPNDFSLASGIKIFNPHFGYPSILPLSFGMLASDSQVYKETIKKIKLQLDSQHGLTSISRYDSLYLGSISAYWRGPVWININYLFLRGLKLYYSNENQLYKKLRNDLISTVCGQESQRGYFYENYIQGRGSFSYPFTGWTALISIIVKESF